VVCLSVLALPTSGRGLGTSAVAVDGEPRSCERPVGETSSRIVASPGEPSAVGSGSAHHCMSLFVLSSSSPCPHQAAARGLRRGARGSSRSEGPRPVR
jgi:hypothetical protein